jgi:hypothetical protein
MVLAIHDLTSSSSGNYLLGALLKDVDYSVLQLLHLTATAHAWTHCVPKVHNPQFGTSSARFEF